MAGQQVLGIDPSVIQVLIGAAVAVFIVVGSILIVRSRRDALSDQCEQPRDPLASYREAYDRGQMTEEEYRKIQETLGVTDDLFEVVSRAKRKRLGLADGAKDQPSEPAAGNGSEPDPE